MGIQYPLRCGLDRPDEQKHGRTLSSSVCPCVIAFLGAGRWLLPQVDVFESAAGVEQHHRLVVGDPALAAQVLKSGQ